MEDEALRALIREVLGGIACGMPAKKEIPIEMSARHVHLTQEAVERLFGPGTVLGIKKELSQPGEFLSDRRVKIITPKGEIANVAVLGPVRSAIQAELSLTDARLLGISVPVNLSGDLNGAADISLLGDAGVLFAPKSAIAAKAHVHLTPEGAEAYGVRDGEHVSVEIRSTRPITVDDVVVRVRKTFSTMVHIDTDEANACGGLGGAKAYLIRRDSVPCGTARQDQPASSSCSSGFVPIQPGAPAYPVPRSAPAAETGLTWAEGKLLNEEAARKLSREIRTGTVRVRKGTIVTAAAKDVFLNHRIEIIFV